VSHSLSGRFDLLEFELVLLGQVLRSKEVVSLVGHIFCIKEGLKLPWQKNHRDWEVILGSRLIVQSIITKTSLVYFFHPVTHSSIIVSQA
jgi:hypothetical protein